VHRNAFIIFLWMVLAVVNSWSTSSSFSSAADAFLNGVFDGLEAFLGGDKIS
jgi:hypothetical protein